VATEDAGPGCEDVFDPMNAAEVGALKVAIKCAAFEALWKMGVMCEGVADYIADALVSLLPNGAYDEPCVIAIQCMCGACPGTCSYNNRQSCALAGFPTR